MVTFAELKKIPIATYLQHKGLLSSLKRANHYLKGTCPIHQGDNPHAFVVDTRKNLWHCFTRCQSGGDIIELVRKLESIHYNQVAHYLKFAIHQQNTVISNKPVAFKAYTYRLPLNHHHSWLQDKGILPETALKFDAGFYPGKGLMSKCIAVRLFDMDGQPLGYAGRRANEKDSKKYGKWKFPRHFPKNKILFNWHRIKHKSWVVIVECPWGVMRLTQLRIPAVALLGTQLSEYQCNKLAKFNEVILLMDGDHAGISAAKKIHNQLQHKTDVSIIRLPDKKDPDDMSDSSLVEMVYQFLL